MYMNLYNFFLSFTSHKFIIALSNATMHGDWARSVMYLQLVQSGEDNFQLFFASDNFR